MSDSGTVLTVACDGQMVSRRFKKKRLMLRIQRTSDEVTASVCFPNLSATKNELV